MRLPNFWTGLVPVLVITVLSATGCVNPTPNPDPDPKPSLKPAKLTMSGNTVYGGITIGQTHESIFTVSNTGEGDATLDQSILTNFGVAGPYTITGGTCATTAIIQANSKNSCTLNIKFTPVGEAHAFQDVTLNYTDPTLDPSQDAAVPFKFTLDGYGILDCTNFPQPQCPAPAAVLSISDGATDNYSTVTLGTSADHIFTVTNTGRAAAVLGDMTAAGLGLTGPYSVSTETCATGASVAALTGSCTITVHFAPTAVPGATATMVLAYSSPAGNAQTSRAMQGAGVLDCVNHRVALCPPQAPALSISDATTFDFGSVAIGAAGSHSFTVTNTGDADASLVAITSASIGLSAPYSLIDGSCVSATSIAANGGSCTINVGFTPSAVGQLNETIDVKYSGPTITGNADLTRAIRGTGFLDCDNYPQPQCPAVMPDFQFTDTSANSYGNVAIGTSRELTFIVTNLGRADGTIGSVTDGSLGLSGAMSVSGGTCGGGSVLAARGGSCTLSIRFTPGDTSTTAETFSLAYAGTNGFANPLTRQIFGTGILDCLAANDLFAAYLSGVSTAQTQNQSEADQGTADGELIALTNGYNDGYAAAYQSAYTAAYNQSYNNAYNSSYSAGFSSGSSDPQSCVDGSNAGGSAGTSDGSSKAYGDGLSNGSIDGYNAGNSAGFSDGLALGQSAGNNAGGNNGSADGYTDGYGNGYGGGVSSGHAAGYSVGFDDGANSCPTTTAAKAPVLQRVIQLRAASASSHSAGTSAKLGSAKSMFASVASTSDYTGVCNQQGYDVTYDSNSYQNALFSASHSGTTYNASYATGAADATTDASAAGSTLGVSDGNSFGSTDGLAAGKQVQYNTCYASAYSAGYTTGYNDQYTTTYNSTFDSYFSGGYDDGHNSGYNSGFNETYGGAYVSAYNTSYSDGFAAGDSDGYSVGYSAGYSDGYQAGLDSCPIPNASSKGTVLAMRTQLLTTSAAPKLFGSGQKWAKTARNGVKVTAKVSRPIRNGVRVSAKVQMNARLKARQQHRPRVRSAILK